MCFFILLLALLRNKLYILTGWHNIRVIIRDGRSITSHICSICPSVIQSLVRKCFCPLWPLYP